jgi:hypothetical protein
MKIEIIANVDKNKTFYEILNILEEAGFDVISIKEK